MHTYIKNSVYSQFVFYNKSLFVKQLNKTKGQFELPSCHNFTDQQGTQLLLQILTCITKVKNYIPHRKPYKRKINFFSLLFIIMNDETGVVALKCCQKVWSMQHQLLLFCVQFLITYRGKLCQFYVENLSKIFRVECYTKPVLTYNCASNNKAKHVY